MSWTTYILETQLKLAADRLELWSLVAVSGREIEWLKRITWKNYIIKHN